METGLKPDVRERVQQEALDAVAARRRAGLNISMGVGKTLIGLKHMKQHLDHNPGAQFLVVAPKVSIYNSWKDDAVKFGLSELLDCITFTTYRSLEKQHQNYDVVYLDECHSLLYSHQLWLQTFPGRTLGLTGTAPRHSNSEKGEMVDMYCPIMYNYITNNAVDEGVLNDYKIIIHTMELSKKKNVNISTKTGKSWMTSEREQYDYWDRKIANGGSFQEMQHARIMRMRVLMDFKTKETYAKNLIDHINNKCIIFANTQEQADRLCLYSYHSNNPLSENNLEAFKSGMIKQLSCVQQLNEGVNIPNLKSGVIMHSYSNERKANQRIGRLLRLNPDDTATIHILMYSGTVDEHWVMQALGELDPAKILFSDPIEF
jgi:superfamily II DNA or RNA helicase